MARSVWDSKKSPLQDPSPNPQTTHSKLVDDKMAKLAAGGIGRYAFIFFLFVMAALGWTIKGKPYDRSNISPYQLAKPHNLQSKLDLASNVLDTNAVSAGNTKGRLVPFEAHIMSKCPDAQYCLQNMVLPAMQRVVSKVDFNLSFIGVPTTEDGVSCKHGASECMGDILELCAANLYPDPKQYLGFTMCLTRDYEQIPDKDLVEDCALEHGLEFERLNACASADDGSVGMRMLRESVLRSIEAKVTKSCTVRVDNEIYCIRDGGEWKDCPHGAGVNDLVLAIEKLHSSYSS